MKRNMAIRAASLALAGFFFLSGCSVNKTEPDGIDLVLEKDGEWLAGYEQFLRVDMDSSDAWQMELENLRIITEGRYELGGTKEKYGLDLSYEVDTTGMDNLNASASGQFSEPQFRALARTLREAAGDREIVIVDLREECHYLLNGISISHFSLHNWDNLGLTLSEIEQEEQEVFGSLIGQTITAYVEDDEVRQDDQITMVVETAMSEKELVESEGFTYLRIPCTDHAWPAAEAIDTFIEYTASVDLDNTWFHFHCHAGSGRTGTFMMLYDKMRNPDVADKDIVYRQTRTGSNYPFYLGDPDSYKAPLYAEKAEMAPKIFQYVSENHQDGYSVSLSEWLKNK